MGDRAAKDALFEGFAEVAKALSSGRRAEIVDVLAQGERSVEEIAVEIDQSVANTSHHLRALARAGLLTTRRDGTRIYYALASDRVGDLWSAVRDVAEAHVAGLEKLAGAYLGDRDGIEIVDRDELAARLRRRDLIVLDVRPDAEYQAGHITGARSVPVGELRRHLKPFRRAPMSSPTAAGPTASTPTTRCASSTARASGRAASSTASPSGSEPDSPSPSATPDDETRTHDDAG